MRGGAGSQLVGLVVVGFGLWRSEVVNGWRSRTEILPVWLLDLLTWRCCREWEVRPHRRTRSILRRGCQGKWRCSRMSSLQLVVLISADECISGVIGKNRAVSIRHERKYELRVVYLARQGRCHRHATLRYKSIFPSGGMKKSRKGARNTLVSVSASYSSHFDSFSCVRCSWWSRVSPPSVGVFVWWKGYSRVGKEERYFSFAERLVTREK